MKCRLCGLEFNESDGEAACKGCPVGRSCSMLKCPNCGYEVPGESGLLKLFKKWKEKRNAAKRQG